MSFLINLLIILILRVVTLQLLEFLYRASHVLFLVSLVLRSRYIFDLDWGIRTVHNSSRTKNILINKFYSKYKTQSLCFVLYNICKTKILLNINALHRD